MATRATSTTWVPPHPGRLAVLDEVEIAGQREDDTITLQPTSLSGHVRVLGDTDGLAGGDDTIIVNRLPTMTALRDRLDDGTSALVRDAVDLDGRGGTDSYFVNTWGSNAAVFMDNAPLGEELILNVYAGNIHCFGFSTSSSWIASRNPHHNPPSGEWKSPW